jgi:hypothetical protein
MSVTVIIMGVHATLADGMWHSASPEMREILNSHLASVQLEVGGHLPPAYRERELARLAIRDLGGKIVHVHDNFGVDPPRTPDGNLTVF